MTIQDEFNAAVLRSDIDTAQKKLDGGAQIINGFNDDGSPKDSYYFDTLDIAVEGKVKLEMLEFLLDKGAKINNASNESLSSFYFPLETLRVALTSKVDAKVIKLLVERGARVANNFRYLTDKGMKEGDLLRIAVDLKLDPEVIDILLLAGAWPGYFPEGNQKKELIERSKYLFAAEKQKNNKELAETIASESVNPDSRLKKLEQGIEGNILPHIAGYAMEKKYYPNEDKDRKSLIEDSFKKVREESRARHNEVAYEASPAMVASPEMLEELAKQNQQTIRPTNQTRTTNKLVEKLLGRLSLDNKKEGNSR